MGWYRRLGGREHGKAETQATTPGRAVACEVCLRLPIDQLGSAVPQVSVESDGHRR